MSRANARTVSLRDRMRPADADVVLTASHTHSGPGGLVKGFWELAMGKYDPELTEEQHAALLADLRDVA